MKIGAKIYYELITGNVILNTWDKQGAVVETSFDEDYFSYNDLKSRDKATIGLIKLDFGQYAEDFATCNGYRVNLNTKQLEFSYPDTTNPVEPVFQKPLSEQVTELKGENSILKYRLNQLDSDMMSFMEFIIGQ